MTATLDVSGLCVDVRTRGGVARVVSDVSLQLVAGRTFGLVGESGSGKTMTSLAIMGVLPRAARTTAGSIALEGIDILGLSRHDLEDVRGRKIAMIFQDAIRSLNPGFTVGDQVAEAARRHLGLDRRMAWARAVDMLGRVGIRAPERRARDYPHQFSGGMAQRVMMAMALVCEPRFLIADEPTTALDVTVQAQVLRLLLHIQAELDLGVLFITHDLGVVAEMCDDVAVMYGGEIVERADTRSLFRRPNHPYTEGLLDAVPTARAREGSFGFIPGVVPSPLAWPPGCRFEPRCTYRMPACQAAHPALATVDGDGCSRCVRVHELSLRGVDGGRPA